MPRREDYGAVIELDFMTELSKGTPYAMHAADKVYNRINGVRRKHGQRADLVYPSGYGSGNIGRHSLKNPDAEAPKAEREDSLTL